MQILPEKIREAERDTEDKTYPSIFPTPVHQLSSHPLVAESTEAIGQGRLLYKAEWEKTGNRWQLNP